ncbi:ATP-binding cassette domain-containing protein [Nocardioides humi]|uniref:ABC transporter domain-containing protein n=1 Tax=Nocardioides humi TaxID=449461 RepID=A0ABN1ZU98_9ACTN|nr:ATP-binding cassette domain-containing protein [Nocardioides humi]
MSPLVELEDLTVVYGGRRGRGRRVLDGVSLEVRRGETLGLVGESGSGKTTLSRALLGLVPVAGGAVRFDGRDITHASRRERRALSQRMQVVFQNPFLALNPQRTIVQSVAETLVSRSDIGREEARARSLAMLERVGVPASAADRYPGSFSGGQRQRIAIARALVPRPELVVCDEAVSALDLSIQAQVLNLLVELQDELSLTYLFITHDLAVVRYLCHRVAVLRHGELVETGDTAAVCAAPGHPYTRSLLDSAPIADPRVSRGIA